MGLFIMQQMEDNLQIFRQETFIQQKNEIKWTVAKDYHTSTGNNSENKMNADWFIYVNITISTFSHMDTSEFCKNYI